MADRTTGKQPDKVSTQGEWHRRRPVWPEIEPAYQMPIPAHPRPRRRRQTPRWWRIPAAIAGGLFVLSLLFLGGIAWVEWSNQGRIYPNVYVAGVNLGGLTPEDAEVALRLRYQDFQDHPLTLVYEDWVWRPSGSELGLVVDWTQAVSDAMAVGRSGAGLQVWQQRWQCWTSRHDLLLPIYLDDKTLRAYLAGLGRKINVDPLDAALVVRDQQVTIQLGHAGRTLEVIPSALVIREALGRLSRGPLSLVVQTIPPEVSEHDIQAAKAIAEKMVSAPLTLRALEHTWTLTPAQIAAMLKVERRQEAGRNTLAVVLDQEALRAYAQKIAGEARIYPRNAHFRFVDGQLQITDEGAPGWEVPVEAVIGQINEAVLSTTRRDIQLEVQQVLPQIRRETIAQMGIREEVGVGESHFVGSRPYRLHNIAVAAAILDGTLIPPGGTFSFIQAIGNIDEGDGFVPGYSIIGGRTVLNVGGGVCQVSTTVFRAAFFAGLPITERHAHAFRVAYYEQGSVLGLDATIYTGTGTDLKFVNDTAGYLLMQIEVYTETGEMYVYLYGTKPNREVIMEGPYLSNWTPAPTEPVYVYNPALPQGYIRQTDWAHDGVDATIYRRILVNGQEVARDTFYSHYQAWPNVFEVGVGSP